MRVHELMQEVQELQKSKQELNDQVEHWRYRAQEVLEQKALDVMKADQTQTTSATEDILLDIKKLQQVLAACDLRSVLYRRRPFVAYSNVYAERGILAAAGKDAGA